MLLVEQDFIYHLELLCLSPVLMGMLLLKLYFSNVGYWLPFVLSLVDKWLNMSIFYTSGLKCQYIPIKTGDRHRSSRW
jgi:hypothetical protein